jgi:hypothetical protein
MTTARAIQVSVTHLSVGVVTGSVIESLMPSYSASSSTGVLAFEAFVQIALNGVLVSQVGAQLAVDGDPTFGLPFSLGLFEAQPGLLARIAFLASVTRKQVAQLGQKMVPRAPEEAPANPHS